MLSRRTPVFSEIVRRPEAMASAGSAGVDASLNISSLPFVSNTKSVNVPPVSTPTRQAAGAGGRRRFLFITDLSAYCRLSPAQLDLEAGAEGRLQGNKTQVESCIFFLFPAPAACLLPTGLAPNNRSHSRPELHRAQAAR